MSAFPRVEILPAVQRTLWPQLAVVTRFPFVLYGGTAIALHLGHRVSVDFDFFTHLDFRPDDLVEQYTFLRGGEILQSQPNTLTVITPSHGSGGVKVSFFGELKFGRLGEPQKTPDGVLNVASLDDLFAHKLKTVLQRVEVKDYFDVDALIQSGLRLSTGLAGAQRLFPAFSPQECLKALTYFEDDTLRELPPATAERLVAAVQGVQSIPKISPASSTLSD